MRIRQGNDFIFLWAIERSGEPEDFSNAVNIRLHFKNFDCIGEVKSFQIVDGNIVRVEVSPEWASNLGAYRLILSYEFEDLSYSDGDRKCVVDVLAFNIVPKTSEADDVSEMAKTTDIMIGLKGDKGDPFTYDDFTPEQIEDLKRPAIDAAESVLIVENQISINEQGRVLTENERETAETTRVSNENNRVTAEATRVSNENNRVTAEATRVSNENNRVTAEGLRVNAESLREQQEQARQANTATAITNAENAITDVNVAKDDYYDVVKPAIQAQGNYAQEQGDYAKAQGEVIQDDLALKADQADLAQLENDVEQLSYVKIKNEVVNGNFENGLIAPFSKDDDFGGASTLAINSSTPISGNYDIRFTIITPSTGGRPILFGLHGAANIGDKIYLHFYAKILSGTPNIRSIHDGENAVSIYAGDVINGRNTRIIDVEDINDYIGRIYFNSPSVWDMQMDNFMRINLTETFGAGNEPTEEEMNLLISTLGIEYFEGEITIPAQKIMQWQLKLIRKKGDKGDKGEKGDTGIGVPTGGTTGQQLVKKSNVDYDFEWQTPAGAGDMLKSEYDKNGNGIVDNAEKVNGFTVETNVPANAKFTDTVYTHPETHPASIILQNSSNRFVSDAEKLAWNDKVDNSRVLTDVPENAKFTDTVYTHPTSHPYSMITGAPTSLPANGGDSATVNGKTVEADVPAGAKFTDTTYEEITEAEINTGTASTLRTITARRVTFILSKVSTLISNAISALTKSDVGLGNLDNIQQATKAEFNTHDADGTRHITAGERSAWGAKWDYNESTIKDVKVNNAANADTVNGKTVEENVPAGAKFTDTVYTHPAGTNPHGTTKADVGLGNVNNTSDADKPVSTAQQTAINSGVAEAKTYADGKFALAIPLTQKGAASGVAELDAEGIILSSQLPSYVDDVLEFATLANFPTTGESGKIYVAINNNLTYRWTGTTYVEISPSIALGETSSTAYRGDRGKIAYDHSLSEHQTIINGTGFVKANGKTLSYDNSSYSLSSHNHSGVYQPLHTGLTNIATQSANATIGLLKKTAANTWTFDTNTYSLSNHDHAGIYEPVFSKNTAFNKNFGTTAGTVAQGNDSRILNGQTAFGWGNHSSAGYALNSALTAHINKIDNPHEVTKSQVGLGNVDNTSDANKPVSTAQAAAIALKIDANKFQVVTELPASPVTGVFYFVKE